MDEQRVAEFDLFTGQTYNMGIYSNEFNNGLFARTIADQYIAVDNHLEQTAQADMFPMSIRFRFHKPDPAGYVQPAATTGGFSDESDEQSTPDEHLGAPTTFGEDYEISEDDLDMSGEAAGGVDTFGSDFTGADAFDSYTGPPGSTEERPADEEDNGSSDGDSDSDPYVDPDHVNVDAGGGPFDNGPGPVPGGHR